MNDFQKEFLDNQKNENKKTISELNILKLRFEEEKKTFDCIQKIKEIHKKLNDSHSYCFVEPYHNYYFKNFETKSHSLDINAFEFDDTNFFEITKEQKNFFESQLPNSVEFSIFTEKWRDIVKDKCDEIIATNSNLNLFENIDKIMVEFEKKVNDFDSWHLNKKKLKQCLMPNMYVVPVNAINFRRTPFHIELYVTFFSLYDEMIKVEKNLKLAMNKLKEINSRLPFVEKKKQSSFIKVEQNNNYEIGSNNDFSGNNTFGNNNKIKGGI